MAQTYIAGHRAYGEPDLAPLHCILDEQLGLAEEADATGRVIETLILEALALQAGGEIDQAMALLLERALTLAAPERFTLTFLRHGAPMAELLREAAARGTAAGHGMAAAFADRLLAARTRESRHERPEAEAFPQPSVHRPSQAPLLEPLSRRELEVLRLLATSLTGPEIAGELFISVNTVRTHTKSIYSKLGVHSRIEATERARDLGLV
jgi:LuxR family maltose regulon positive regulatory protein